jgi:radical SAM enzyme (TIGR01210 family)
MESIRNIPKPLKPGPAGKAKGSEIWEGNLDGEPANRLIIYLRSSGCSWVVDSNNPNRFHAGCLDCEHSITDTTYGVPISTANYFRQFIQEFEHYDLQTCPVLCLYNEGSFFNEQELPADARRQILKHIAANGHVKRLVLESLPEYLTESVLIETKELLRGVELGVGLESSDQTIRELCINKPYSLKSYEKMAQMVRRHCRLLAYILLKPSFLTENEALEDTLSTISYAFQIGVDAVSIEPISPGTYTMSGILHYLEIYKSAWLWSVLECAKVAANHGEVRIGGYQFAPSYLHHSNNCEKCTVQVKNDIRNFNETYRLDFLSKTSCACLEIWKQELAREYPPLESRIPEQLDKIDLLLRRPNLWSILEAR